jgi:hypothetical protein
MQAQLVPRIEDLPYISSPPIQFVYTSDAPFALGVYTWADKPSPLTPVRPLMHNVLYYFRSITMSADIEETSYTSNISVMPAFQMYLKSRQQVILFREPILMTNYFQNFDYRFVWMTQHEDDQLYASFNGVLNQDIDLVGITPITLTAVISAQEIVDEGFIAAFKQKYSLT